MSTSTRQYIAGVWCVLVGVGAVAVYPHVRPEGRMIQLCYTVAGVGWWLQAVHCFSTGLSRRNPSQLASFVAFAMCWSILTCQSLLAETFGLPLLWPSLGVLLMFASALFRLRAISTKYANRRAARHA